MSYVFKTGMQYSDLGRQALASGLLLPHEEQRGTTIGYAAPTYREIYAMGYGKEVSKMNPVEKFVHSQKLYWSNFLAPAVSIGRIAGIAEYAVSGFDEKSMLTDTSRERQLLRMGATGMSEEDAYGLPKYAIYEPTLLEAGMGSVIESIQHEIDKGDSIIPNWTGSVEGGDLEWGSEKVWQEGEHVARPAVTLVDDKRLEGAAGWSPIPLNEWTGAAGSSTYLGDAQGSWNEMAQKFGHGGSTGIHGAIAQLPLEVAMMVVPVGWMKPALMAATVAGANVMKSVALKAIPRTLDQMATLKFGKGIGAAANYGKETYFGTKFSELSERAFTKFDIARIRHGTSYQKLDQKLRNEVNDIVLNAKRDPASAKNPADRAAIESAKMWRNEKEHIAQLAAQQHYTTRTMGAPTVRTGVQYAKSKVHRLSGLQGKIDKTRPLGDYAKMEFGNVPTDAQLFGRVRPLLPKSVSGRVAKIAGWDMDDMAKTLKQSWFWRDRSYQAGALLHRSRLDVAITNLYRSLPVGVRKQLERVPRRMTQRDRLNKMLDDMFRSALDKHGKNTVRAQNKAVREFAEFAGKKWKTIDDFDKAMAKAEADGKPLITIYDDVATPRTPIGQSQMSVDTLPWRARGEIIVEGKDGQKMFLSNRGARYVFPDDTEGAMVNIPLWKVGEKTLDDWTGRAGEVYGVLKPTQYAAEKLAMTKPDPILGMELKIKL